MSFEATISRKKALDAATKAVEQADLLTIKHNETIEEVAKIRKGLTRLQEHSEKRLDAQLAMIAACERHHVEQLTYIDRQDAAMAGYVEEYANRADARLARMIEAHQQMGFFARVRWLLTGHVPAIEVGRGMVSAGRGNDPVGEPGTGPVKPHETPRPARKTARSREDAEALLQ